MTRPSGPRWVGIDVSKATLDVAILPDEVTFQLTNDATGWEQLVTRGELATVQGIVLEATGSYHLGVTLALAGADHPPAVINPQRTHAFMVSEGMRSKTDRGDARLLARFGQQKQPAPTPVLSENARILRDLVGCRDDLTKHLVMEKNRRGIASAHVRDVHDTMIAFLIQQIAEVDQRIAALIAADAELTARAAVLRSAPGLGPVLSAVLLARLAELGQRDPKTLASLAGVAPHARDSGTRRGARTIGGGRPAVCKALFQMAQTAVRSNAVMRALPAPAAADAPQTRRDRLCPADAGHPQCDGPQGIDLAGDRGRAGPVSARSGLTPNTVTTNTRRRGGGRALFDATRPRPVSSRGSKATRDRPVPQDRSLWRHTPRGFVGCTYEAPKAATRRGSWDDMGRKWRLGSAACRVDRSQSIRPIRGPPARRGSPPRMHRCG